MCGIALIYAYSPAAPEVDRAELMRIRERMVSRGPEGAGEWYSPDGRVGLAHRRLKIIDLSENAAQPMTSADGRFVITFNGEIYNFQELKAGLEKKGRRFRSTSDTEVLLALYEEKGAAMLHDLRGMFAFAIWDAQTHALFLARDPFGIKPLYYADDGQTLRAASQVKALLAGGKVDTAPQPAGHVGYFLWGTVPEPHTLYRGIKALPAGHSLLLEKTGKKTLAQYCSIPQELAAAASRGASHNGDGVHDELRAALLDTVRAHLVADVPVGVFLSSGMDSTTLAALTEEVAPGSLHTVTLGFKEFAGTHNDEVPLAEEVARRYHAQHRTIMVERHDFEGQLSRLLDAMDQPSLDGVNSYFVCQAAAKAGLKVALSGLGGDELFGSYPSFRQIPKLVRSLGPLAGVPGLGRGLRWVAAPVLKHFTSPKYAGLIEYGGSYAGAYLLRRGMYMPWELPQVLDPDLVAQGWRDLESMARLRATTIDVPNLHLKVSALEMCWYMKNQLLRDSDWASMAHSVEVRLPFVDLTLLRKITPLFCSATPAGKNDMARTPALPLPEAVLTRAKTGFSVPVREWLIEDGDHGHERGLRGWTKKVYGLAGRMPGTAAVVAR